MALKLGTIFGGSSAAVAGAAGAVSVMMAAAVGVMMMRGGEEAETPLDPVTPPQVEAPAPEVAEDPAPDITQDPVATEETAPETDLVDTPLLPDPPVFDLVRVEADGSAVVAGRSSAEALVTLRLDGDPLHDVEADAAGAFVALLSLAPSDAPRVLSLEAVLYDSAPVRGPETVIIAPFGVVSPQEEMLAAVEPEPELDVDPPSLGELTSAAPAVDSATDRSPDAEELASLPEPMEADAPSADTVPATLPEAEPVADPPVPPAPVQEMAEAAPDVTDVPDATDAPEAPSEAAPAAPAVLIASDEGVRVLQSAGDAPEAQTEVRLDAISYSAEGDVTLSGRAPATSELRVLLNNEPIQMGEVGPGGDWSLDLPDVDPGTYTLSVEQLTDEGVVSSRIDTPFLREDPERIAASPMLVDQGASVITVQPGFTLWGIAQANFGEGTLYVSIFEENRDQIRDPDLIFPGQIFELPDLPRQ